jgi:hypothetical protein
MDKEIYDRIKQQIIDMIMECDIEEFAYENIIKEVTPSGTECAIRDIPLPVYREYANSGKFIMHLTLSRKDGTHVGDSAPLIKYDKRTRKAKS